MRGARLFVVSAVSVLAAGCSALPDAVNPVEWYKDVRAWVDDDGTWRESRDAEIRARTTAFPDLEGPFPHLSTVPERSRVTRDDNRSETEEGLKADRDRAHRSDERIRRRAATPAPAPLPRRAKRTRRAPPEDILAAPPLAPALTPAPKIAPPAFTRKSPAPETPPPPQKMLNPSPEAVPESDSSEEPSARMRTRGAPPSSAYAGLPPDAVGVRAGAAPKMPRASGHDRSRPLVFGTPPDDIAAVRSTISLTSPAAIDGGDVGKRLVFAPPPDDIQVVAAEAALTPPEFRVALPPDIAGLRRGAAKKMPPSARRPSANAAAGPRLVFALPPQDIQVVAIRVAPPPPRSKPARAGPKRLLFGAPPVDVLVVAVRAAPPPPRPRPVLAAFGAGPKRLIFGPPPDDIQVVREKSTPPPPIAAPPVDAPEIAPPRPPPPLIFGLPPRDVEAALPEPAPQLPLPTVFAPAPDMQQAEAETAPGDESAADRTAPPVPDIPPPDGAVPDGTTAVKPEARAPAAPSHADAIPAPVIAAGTGARLPPAELVFISGIPPPGVGPAARAPPAARTAVVNLPAIVPVVGERAAFRFVRPGPALQPLSAGAVTYIPALGTGGSAAGAESPGVFGSPDANYYLDRGG